MTSREQLIAFTGAALALYRSADQWDDATYALLEQTGGEIEDLFTALCNLEDAING